MGSPIYAPTEWRFTILAPQTGTWKKVSILTRLAQDVELLYQLNRPTMLTFSVPSDHPQVNIPHTDGLPYLAVGPRWVLGWRKSPSSLDPTPGGWELKFSGRVWDLQDQGDGDTCRTMVTCFDALKILEKRIVRSATGNFAKQVKWWETPGTTVIKEMIDRTQSLVGTCRIDTAGGHWVDSEDQTVAFDQAYVMPSIQRITDDGSCDLDPEWLSGSDNDFLRLGGLPRLGTDKSNIILGYAAPPRRATNFDRTTSLDNLANAITLFGKSSKGNTVTVSDADSQEMYDIFEDVSVVPDVEPLGHLTFLAEEELFLRKNPHDLVTIVPSPEDSPRFFNEYFIGDSIKLKASKPPTSTTFPDTREAVIGLQRIYGVRLAVDNDYGEHVTELIASAQAES